MRVMYNNNYTCCEIGNKIENVSFKAVILMRKPNK